MNAKLGLFISAFYLLLSIMGCDATGDNIQRKRLHFSNGRELVEHLDRLFVQLAQIDPASPESKPVITSVNEQIRKTIEGITTQRLLEEISGIYKHKIHDFGFVLSENQQLAVFSWDTGRDHTNKFKNVALYIKGQKVIPTSMYGEPIIYRDIHTISNPGNKPYYVLHGRGKTQDGHRFYRLDALSVSPDGLSEVPAFPNRQSSIISARPLGSDSNLSADFSVERDGSLILKPEFWNPTVVYRPLELINDHIGYRYLEGSFTLEHPMVPGDFKSKNKNHFINGSETPIKIHKDPYPTYIFDDHIKVTLVQNETKNTMQIQAGIYGASLIDLQVSAHTGLIGKKGDLLFLLEKEANHKVWLYNLSEKKVLWTKSMEDLLISKGKLIFTEPVEAYQVSNKEEIDCNLGTGVQQTYYKVYAFDIDALNPIVEYTQQIFCGYRENQSLAKL